MVLVEESVRLESAAVAVLVAAAADKAAQLAVEKAPRPSAYRDR